MHILGGDDQLEVAAKPSPVDAQFNLFPERTGDDGQRRLLGEQGHQRRHSGKEVSAGRSSQQDFAIGGRLLLNELFDPLWILGFVQPVVFTQGPLKASSIVQPEIFVRILFWKKAHALGDEHSTEQLAMERFVVDENSVEVKDDCLERSGLHFILPQRAGSTPLDGSPK